MLSRLPDDFHALVTGASGGIGAALVDALLGEPRLGRLYAVSRREVRRDDARLAAMTLDLTEPAGLEALGSALPDRPLHLMINTLGMLHDEATGITPEKKLDDLDAAAVELRRLNPNATVVCLHPGTTDTALSAPFQARVPEGKLFSPAFVAERLLAVLDERTPADSGEFRGWDDAGIPW